jgi:hypothetical protein
MGVLLCVRAWLTVTACIAAALEKPLFLASPPDPVSVYLDIF